LSFHSFGPQTKIKISISIFKINKLYNYSFQITACKVCINEAKNEVIPAAGQRFKRHEHDHDHIHDHSHAVEHDHGVRQLCPGLCKDETMTAVSFICLKKFLKSKQVCSLNKPAGFEIL
jgi:ABC-type Zn2+ transport system substrate-binding protein/surface adhesin